MNERFKKLEYIEEPIKNEIKFTDEQILIINYIENKIKKQIDEVMLKNKTLEELVYKMNKKINDLESRVANLVDNYGDDT